MFGQKGDVYHVHFRGGTVHKNSAGIHAIIQDDGALRIWKLRSIGLTLRGKLHAEELFLLRLRPSRERDFVGAGTGEDEEQEGFVAGLLGA